MKSIDFSIQESVPNDSRWSWQQASAASQGGLHFQAQLPSQKKDTWGSVKPPSYAMWSCRETPWREANRSPLYSARQSRTQRVDAWRKRCSETPSTRCPSRALQTSPAGREGVTPSPEGMRERSANAKVPAEPVLESLQSMPSRLGPKQGSWLLTHQGDRDCMASLMSSASDALERHSLELGTATSPQAKDSQITRHAETMEGLRVASNVMGQRARGPVTLGLRVKAVSRLAVAAAVRQLVHLPAGRGPPEETQLDGERTSPLSSPRSLFSHNIDFESSESSNEEAVPPPAASADSLAAMLSSAAKSCKLSSKIQHKRFREVLANTTLGKMVEANPQQAAKFGLQVVPPWSHNKPWPPPPVVAHFSSQPSTWALRLLEKTEERKKKEEEGARRRMSMNMEKRFSRKLSNSPKVEDLRSSASTDVFNNIASAVSSQRKRQPRASVYKGQAAHMRRQSRAPVEEEEERLQDLMDQAVKIHKMNVNEKEATILCFQKHSEASPGYVTSKALLRGLAEMEIKPKNFREKQKMKEVQELVIKKYRKEDANFEAGGVKNPLKHKKGGWLYEEFLAMTATYKEIMREEQVEIDQALADQNGCELAIIMEYRKVYNENRSTEFMTVKDVLAILSKVGIRNPSDKELATLLNLPLGPNLELSRLRKIAFVDFIPAMLKIQGMLAQVQGDPEEET